MVSNRGPVSFGRDNNGELVARRGSGGLVSGLTPIMANTGATWVAAALNDDDRAAADTGVIDTAGFRVATVSVDPRLFTMAYDVVCNATLWFVHHGLFESARRPIVDDHFTRAWQSYVAVNDAFADVVAEVAPAGAVVLIQDYHLCLVGQRLRTIRPDIDSVHFTHTPFTGPDGLRMLPDAVATQLLEGMSAHVACGFHADRWARRFVECCNEVLGTTPTTFVAPLGPDAADLALIADTPAAKAAADDLDNIVGDRKLLVRVDRIELSKNLLRGFRAFDQLLNDHPQWRSNVVFGAFVYPSREGLAEYLAYRQEVEGMVAAINRRWATPQWTPILADFTDDHPRSMAALTRYDVLLVNPVRDGLNLVAKEGPLLNRRNGVVVLSTESGAAAEFGDTALMVNPFDVSATADALHRALSMDGNARADHAAAVLSVARTHTPGTWLAAQLAAAGA
jgi:trehalose 6-phosphate synthase